MVWRSQDEHPATERQHNVLLTLLTRSTLPALHSATNLEHLVAPRGKQKMENSQTKHFLNRGIKLNDLRNRRVNLLVGMCSARATVGVASVPLNKKTLLYIEGHSQMCCTAIFPLFYASVWPYGAIIALAGLTLDCALDSQSSSCAFSWDPENIMTK